jgi:hypothetical protein
VRRLRICSRLHSTWKRTLNGVHSSSPADAVNGGQCIRTRGLCKHRQTDNKQTDRELLRSAIFASHAMSLAHMHQRVCMQRNAAPSCFRDSKCLIRNSSCGPIKSSRSSRPMQPVGLYGCVVRAKPLTAGDTYMDGTVDVSCICSTVRWCRHVLLQLLKRLLQTRSFRAIPSNASTC